jgi:hypothetical protein
MSKKNGARAALAAAQGAMTTGTTANVGGGDVAEHPGPATGTMNASEEGGDTTNASGTTATSGDATSATTGSGETAQPPAAAAAPTPAPAKPAKVKRDIFDVKTNEHLRKALWSTRGDIRVIVRSGDKFFEVPITKNAVIDILSRDLQAPALWLLQRDRHPTTGEFTNNGATLLDPATVPKADTTKDTNAGSEPQA